METIIEIVDSLARGDTLEALSETGRFLYVYNSTTLIASVGAIVGLILLGSMLWIAVTSAAKTDYKSHHYTNSVYRKKRSFDDEKEEKEYSFVELLAMLDETFRKMEIYNFDCQKRAVCEAHQSYVKGNHGPIIQRFIYILEKLTQDDRPLSALEPESADFLAKYLDSADRGRRNENCAQLYAGCNRSLWDFVAPSSNRIHDKEPELKKN